MRKFGRLVMEAMRPDLEASLKGEGPESERLREALKNHIFDLPGPRYANNTPTERTKYLSQLFRGYSEIATSLDTFRDLKFLVSRFPLRGGRVSGDRYLQIHVEAFLAETYILKVRLHRYLKMLTRQYKGDGRQREIVVLAQVLRQVVDESLKNVVGVRDSHTHEERFKDDGISRLGTIGLLAKGGDKKFERLMKAYYRSEHAKQRQRWGRTIAASIRGVRTLLDAFFGRLLPFLFEAKTGRPRFPQRLRPTPVEGE